MAGYNDFNVILFTPDLHSRNNQNVNTDDWQEIPNEYESYFGSLEAQEKARVDAQNLVSDILSSSSYNDPRNKISTLVNAGYLPKIYANVENMPSSMLDSYWNQYLRDQAGRPQFRSNSNEELSEYDRQRRNWAVRANQLNNNFFLSSMPRMSDEMAYRNPDAIASSTMANGFTANLINAATTGSALGSIIERLLALGAGTGSTAISSLGAGTPIMIARGVGGQTVPMALTMARSYSPWLTYLLGGAAAGTAGAAAGMGIRDYLNNNSYSSGYGAMRDDAATTDEDTTRTGSDEYVLEDEDEEEDYYDDDNNEEEEEEEKPKKKNKKPKKRGKTEESGDESVWQKLKKHPIKYPAKKIGKGVAYYAGAAAAAAGLDALGNLAYDIKHNKHGREWNMRLYDTVTAPVKWAIEGYGEQPNDSTKNVSNDSIQSKQPNVPTDSTRNTSADTVPLTDIDKVIPDQKKIVTSNGDTVQAKTWNTRYSQDKDNKKK